MMRVFLFSVFVLVGQTAAFSTSASANEAWKVVPNSEVCMVTNMHFARPQIPVEQEGKMYYGCCENCKATIQNDKTARIAIDPYSKKEVDKAKAVIAANDQGAVLYFENKGNFDKHQGQNGAAKK